MLSEENKNTAFNIANVMAESVKKQIETLKNEITNMIEAHNNGLLDDASTHASNAFSQLLIIISLYATLATLQCVEDGSWPDDPEEVE